MLFKAATLEGIARAEVTMAFRRWTRPTVKPGGSLRTPVGVLAIEAVDPIETIRDEEAVRAGFASAAAAWAVLGSRDGQLYRIAFHLAGPDPRLALRKQADLAPGEIAALQADLAKLGHWALPALALIGANPGMSAAGLAEALAFEKAALKTRIRRLKELGLTESLERGYRLSSRGAALIREMRR